jgi:GNAT superfamily N-acetyltransferase
VSPVLSVGAHPFDDPVSRALIAELDADLDERYAHDDEEDEGQPDYAMLNVLGDSVRPPLGVFLVARLDDLPVGCGALRPAPTGEPGVAEVKRMYVAPPARGRGVSRSLLVALEAWAADLGYRRVILETGIRQHEAMSLYESAGYSLIDNYGGYRHSLLSRCYGKDLGSR